jgi:hypothetical protein
MKDENYNILKLYMSIQPSENSRLPISSVGGSTVTLLEAVSLYSPLLTMLSILIFSVFSSAMNKGLFYISTIFFVTSLRIGILSMFAEGYGTELNPKCENGKIMPFTGRTYSTFIMMYTVSYFVTPMFILSSVNDENMVNPYVIAFFIAYICFDICMKLFSLNCIQIGMGLIGDFLVGGLLGSMIALLLFYSDKISLMFINELNSNKEVCSVPSKQMFRCSLYKDGMIVGSSVSA